MIAKELIDVAESFVESLRDHYEDSDILDSDHCVCVYKAAKELIAAMQKVTLAK